MSQDKLDGLIIFVTIFILMPAAWVLLWAFVQAVNKWSAR